MTLYDELGVRSLINAATTYTAIGGSLMPAEVLDAMRDAAGSFVDMHELHGRAGEELARLTFNEAAHVTSGCAAAIVLAVLACRTRGRLSDIAALPSGPGLPTEVIVHAAHRMPYDPAVLLAGGTVRSVGNVLQTFEWELEAAISERTAAVLWVAGPHLAGGALSLDDTVRIAHAHEVPVIVDAAAQLPPVANLWYFTKECGADLALFSGGKALRGPQASGLMVGAAELVAAARENAAPHQRYARALKVGKEEIVGLVAAVRRFVQLDHLALATTFRETCTAWEHGLHDVPGVSTRTESRNEAGQESPRVFVEVDAGLARTSADDVVRGLLSGDPAVAVVTLGAGGRGFWIAPDQLQPGEAEVVLARILELLPARC